MPRPIYLDYNGTTPIDGQVVKVMQPFLTDEFGNPSSSHFYGFKPRHAVTLAREQVAGLLNCRPPSGPACRPFEDAAGSTAPRHQQSTG